MSATMFEHDIKSLLPGREYRKLEVEAPIPAQQRPIIFRPTPFKMNYRTDPSKIVKYVEKILDENKGLNTIIHVPYSLQQKMLPYFTRPVLHNTPENKQAIVEQYIKEGGIFLAAGCAEGLDLKDDLCRVNIIVKLMYPNLGDSIVKKRKSLEDGELWYFLETLKTFIQQAGRSTRHQNDWSKVYLMDPTWPWLASQLKGRIPKFTQEAFDAAGE
jgi:Rad3-related DNA helicase